MANGNGKAMEYYIQELKKRKEISAGTPQEVEAQHARKRLTARERLHLLFDAGDFEEIDALVLPRQHCQTLFDLPSDIGEELLAALQLVGRGVMRATAADGINLGMNNYAAAGQLVGHAHFHLIPRFVDDGLKLWPQRTYPNPEKMQSLAAAIKKNIVQA
jgi:histidine triad (HIT) family protein